MRNKSAVQLRAALSAATVLAVIAAAMLGGAHRDALLAAVTARQTEPILAGSISTLMNPAFAKTEASHKTGASHEPSGAAAAQNDLRQGD